MKKTISLLLALVMLLSLAACSSEPEKSGEELAFEAANALLESGDYEGAIAAFSQIGMYQQISAKIQEAQDLLDASNAGFLYGKWMDFSGNDFEMELREGGTGTIVQNDGTTLNMEYEYKDGAVYIQQPLSFTLEVTEVDGIIHLIGEGVGLNLVSEKDYETLGPKEVAITLENWDAYFDMIIDWHHSLTPFGDVDWQVHSCYLILKEEYRDKLPANAYEYEVDFQIEYDYAMYYVENHMTMDLVVTDRLFHPEWEWTHGTDTATGTVIGFAGANDHRAESDPLYNQCGTLITNAHGWSEDGEEYANAIMTRCDVTNVQGSLLLYP